MKSHSMLTLGILCAVVLLSIKGVKADYPKSESGFLEVILGDYDNYYGAQIFSRLSMPFLLGAISANSNLDSNFSEHYQDELRNADTDELSEYAKLLGDGKIILTLTLLASGLDFKSPDTEIERWGSISTRSILTAAPLMLFMQVATGASRPSDDQGSDWSPFEDSNGVSGHAFIGAIPFITLARMNTDRPVLKYTAYGLSLMAAWSRLNDNQHFLSQSFLGWYMAYDVVDSVMSTEAESPQSQFFPVLGEAGSVHIVYRTIF